MALFLVQALKASFFMLRNEKSMDNSYTLSDDKSFYKIYFHDGRYFMVDKEDFELVAARSWSLGKRGYPVSHRSRRNPEGPKTQCLHRYLLAEAIGQDIDHISGNKLDNRRSNLRVCTHQQNMFNQKIRNTNSSGVSGVSYHKQAKKYEAYIHFSGKKINLGLFGKFEDACKARTIAAKKYFGEFVRAHDRELVT